MPFGNYFVLKGIMPLLSEVGIFSIKNIIMQNEIHFGLIYNVKIVVRSAKLHEYQRAEAIIHCK